MSVLLAPLAALATDRLAPPGEDHLQGGGGTEEDREVLQREEEALAGLDLR